MKINATTLQNLNANESYYLSNTTGEIKQAGWLQKLKCLFGIGDGRAKRLCECFGSLNAEFVNLFGDEEWIDMGAPGHRTAFLMLIHALADGVPDFADKVNAVRTELEGISDETFAQHENNGLGDTIRDYLCYDIVPEK